MLLKFGTKNAAGYLAFMDRELPEMTEYVSVLRQHGLQTCSAAEFLYQLGTQ